MSVETVQNAINSRLADEFATPEGVSVQYDNAPFTPPDESAWVRFTILWGASRQTEIGATPKFRGTGNAIAQIFVLEETGTSVAVDYADKIATVFRRVTVGTVTFRTPFPQPVGREGKWWQLNVDCPFIYSF